MDVQKLVMGIVGLVVIILMITVVVIPAAENAQSDVTTTENNANVTYKAIKSQNLTANISVHDGTIVCNGVTISSGITFSIIVADNFEIYIPAGGELDLYDFENDVRIQAATALDVSIVNGVASYTYNEVSRTVTLTGDVYIFADNGDYGRFINTNTFNIDPDKTLSLVRPRLNTNYFVFLSGTITDLKVEHIYVWDSSSSTYSEYEGEYTLNVSGYTLSDDGHSYIVSPSTVITITTTIGGTETIWDLHGIASTIFAPIKYTVTDEGSSLFSLFGLIPLLLIIVAVLYAVRLMGTSRN